MENRSWDKIWSNKVVIDEMERTHFKWDSHRAIMRDRLPKIIEENSTVLDIGSGFGHWYEAVREVEGAKYLGVDYSEKMVERARERYPDASFEVGDAYKLRFADKSFDYVICFDVLRHLRNYEEVIKEMYRVGKHVIFTIFVNDGSKQEWLTNGGDRDGYLVQCYNGADVDKVVIGIANKVEKETIWYHNVGSVMGRFVLYILG